jgi:hypothetical protein
MARQPPSRSAPPTVLTTDGAVRVLSTAIEFLAPSGARERRTVSPLTLGFDVAEPWARQKRSLRRALLT